MKKISPLKIILPIAAVIVAVAIGVGGFYGGMAYQRSQANTTRNDFLTARGLDPNSLPSGNFPGGNPPSGTGSQTGQTGQPGGVPGITGQVKSIVGTTLTLTVGQNEVKVTLPDTAVVEKSVSGAASDLQTGQQVMVTGQRDSSGNLAASQVIILDNQAVNTGINP